MSDDEIARIAESIKNALIGMYGLSADEHARQHQWISSQIKRDENRSKFWQSMNEHVSVWGTISVLSAGGYALWLGIKAIIRASM